jgi:hypothetical protein
MYGTAEQDNASHGWAGHVKAQSMSGGLMLAMIAGILYNIIAYSRTVKNLLGTVIRS